MIRPFFNNLAIEIPFLLYAVPWTNPGGICTVFTDRFWDERENWIPPGVGTVPGSAKPWFGARPAPTVGPLEGTPDQWANGFDYDVYLAGGYSGSCVQACFPITRAPLQQAQEIQALPLVDASFDQAQTIEASYDQAQLEQVQDVSVNPAEGELDQAQAFWIGPAGGELDQAQAFWIAPAAGEMDQAQQVLVTPTYALPYVIYAWPHTQSIAFGSFTIPFTVTTTPGSFLWIGFYLSFSAASVTTPSGWTAGPSKADGTGKCWSFYRYNAPATSSVTFTGWSTKPVARGVAIEIGGVSASGAADLSRTATGTGSNGWGVGSLGPTAHANEFYLEFIGTVDQDVVTGTAGYNWFSNQLEDNTAGVSITWVASRSGGITTFSDSTSAGASHNWSATAQTFTY